MWGHGIEVHLSNELPLNCFSFFLFVVVLCSLYSNIGRTHVMRMYNNMNEICVIQDLIVALFGCCYLDSISSNTTFWSRSIT